MPRNRRDMIYKNAREKVRSRKPHDGNWKVLFLARRQFVSSSFEIEFPFFFSCMSFEMASGQELDVPDTCGIMPSIYKSVFVYPEKKDLSNN